MNRTQFFDKTYANFSAFLKEHFSKEKVNVSLPPAPVFLAGITQYLVPYKDSVESQELPPVIYRYIPDANELIEKVDPEVKDKLFRYLKCFIKMFQ